MIKLRPKLVKFLSNFISFIILLKTIFNHLLSKVKRIERILKVIWIPNLIIMLNKKITLYWINNYKLETYKDINYAKKRSFNSENYFINTTQTIYL